jgi:23S rRNA G2445 N2-methylase RlmL
MVFMKQHRFQPEYYEADVLEGLEDFALDELTERFGQMMTSVDVPRPGTIAFVFDGDTGALLALRSVVAVYRVLTFAVTRPKALLGHEHFTRLVHAIRDVRTVDQAHRFETLRLSAAGEASSVLMRLKHELSSASGLQATNDEADLLLRLRRSTNGDGWDVLLRLSARPLATRDWRVCNLPGSMNASLAHAMMRLTEPAPSDRVLNLMCGSGTLLVERLALAPASQTVGCDTDPEALHCARRNLAAAGVRAQTHLEAWDATQLPVPHATFDVLVADLPFGQLIGSHHENERLYPAFFEETARVARLGARMVLLTHEVRLLEGVAARYTSFWAHRATLPVRSGGMTPRIFAFERLSEDAER